MKYVVSGVTITNDVVFADGTESRGHLGGAVFSLGGVKCWQDDVAYVSAAGPDFDQYYGKYFRDNGLSAAGVRCTLPYTHYDIVKYYPDGRWYEYSIYGETYFADHREAMENTAEMVAAVCGPETKGIYIDSGGERVIWNEFEKIRGAAPGAKIMWELPTSHCLQPELKARTLEVIGMVDMYSLNLPESKEFFGTDSEEASVAAIIALGKPCFFRVGQKGAYWIADGKATFARPVDVDISVDPTGCGNCSTAAAMVGAAEGWDPLMIAIKANIAAGLNARQYGPIPLVNAEIRAEAEALAQKMYEEQSN